MRSLYILILLLSISAIQSAISKEKNDLQVFIENFAKEFDYKVNNGISQCFDESNLEHLAYWVKALKEYSWSIKNGTYSGFMTAAVQTVALTFALEKPFQCVWKTRDFKYFIKELGIKIDDMNEAVRLFVFYIDTYPRYSWEIIDHLWDRIEEGNFEKAGQETGIMLKALLTKEYDLDVMKAIAFVNGVFLRNDLEVPETMRDHCIEGLDTAENIVELFKRWAIKLKDVKEDKALEKTVKYLGTEGFKWYKNAGFDFWSCVRKNDDNKRLVKETKYEFNPYDMNFDFDLGTLLGKEKFAKKYLKLMENLRMVLRKKNQFYLFAGLEFGSIMKMTSEHGMS